MGKVSKRLIPVLIGYDYKHVMAEATILEEGSRVEVSITMVADGDSARDLSALMTAGEPMALSFVPIPVNPRNPTPKESM